MKLTVFHKVCFHWPYGNVDITKLRFECTVTFSHQTILYVGQLLLAIDIFG